MSIDLSHNQLIDLEVLKEVSQNKVEELLCFRNKIKKIEFNNFDLTNLKIIDVQDNLVDKIEGMDSALNLKVLNLGYNRIKLIENLDNLIKLERLYLTSNFISKIQNLNHLKYLNFLELGNNNLTVIT